VAVGFAAATVCLAVTVLVTMRLEAARDEQARGVHQTQATLLALEELGASFGAAAGLDAHPGHQEAWQGELARRALDRIEPALERVGLLVAEDPEPLALFRRLAPAVHALTGRAQAALAAAAEGRAAAARGLLGELGQGSLPAATALLEELRRFERQRLEGQERTWRRAAVGGGAVFAAATLVLLALFHRAARLVRSEIRAREQLSAERADMLALQQQLMAVVSHDLRNPLAAMKSAAGLLVRDGGLDDDHREDARRIVANARRMERLIRDLLDFTRLRAGQGLPLHPDDADLVDICRRAISDLGRDAESRVTVEGLGDVRGVWDRDRLEQVATNLVSNALKYGPALRPVRLVIDGTGADVLMSVKDEGGRIPPVLFQEIFEPFRRGLAGDAQETRSAGLGLFIVRRLSQAHGGQVTVDSAPERGTTFTVRLPRGPAPAAAAAAAGG
jgi:signal transduction histidine kinase